MALAERNLRKPTWEPAEKRLRDGAPGRPPADESFFQRRCERLTGWSATVVVRIPRVTWPQNTEPKIQPSLDTRRIAGPHTSPSNAQRVQFYWQPIGVDWDLWSRCEQTLGTFVLPPGSGEWVNFGAWQVKASTQRGTHVSNLDTQFSPQTGFSAMKVRQKWKKINMSQLCKLYLFNQNKLQFLNHTI